MANRFPKLQFVTGLLPGVYFPNLVRLFFRNLSERKCCKVPRGMLALLFMIPNYFCGMWTKAWISTTWGCLGWDGECSGTRDMRIGLRVFKEAQLQNSVEDQLWS